MSYEVVRSQVVYEGHLGRVRVDAVRMPDGDVADREIAEHKPAVAIVAVDDDDTVLLVRQYRVAVGRYELELPAGIMDVDGEDARATAERELAEETGHAARDWRELTRFGNSVGWTDETTTVFLASGLSQVAVPVGFLASGEEADMEVRRMPLAEAVALAARGTITDAKTIIGLLLADRQR
jgi:8-oxo-dGDP phosphatase